MFGDIGFPELLVIVLIILIVFGAGKLPEVGGAIGKGIKAFRDAQKEPPQEKKEIPTTTTTSTTPKT